MEFLKWLLQDIPTEQRWFWIVLALVLFVVLAASKLSEKWEE